MGMRILKTYVIREYLKPFLLGLSVFAFILFMGNMAQLVKMVFTQRVEAIVALKLLLYLIPFIASYSFPMAVLLSVLLAYSRLSSDNEIVAVKASGINPASLILPCVLLSLLLSLLCVTVAYREFPRLPALHPEGKR
jgi:lipopolysaccharide export system permease protein